MWGIGPTPQSDMRPVGASLVAARAFPGGTPERCRRICSPVGAGALTRPGACGYRPLRPFRQPGADVRQGFGTGQVNLIALDTEHLVSIS